MDIERGVDEIKVKFADVLWCVLCLLVATSSDRSSMYYGAMFSDIVIVVLTQKPRKNVLCIDCHV